MSFLDSLLFSFFFLIPSLTIAGMIRPILPNGRVVERSTVVSVGVVSFFVLIAAIGILADRDTPAEDGWVGLSVIAFLISVLLPLVAAAKKFNDRVKAGMTDRPVSKRNPLSADPNFTTVEEEVQRIRNMGSRPADEKIQREAKKKNHRSGGGTFRKTKPSRAKLLSKPPKKVSIVYVDREGNETQREIDFKSFDDGKMWVYCHLRRKTISIFPERIEEVVDRSTGEFIEPWLWAMSLEVQES